MHDYVMEGKPLPDRIFKSILAQAVPPGLKTVPTISLELAISFVIGLFAGMTPATVALLVTQACAVVSTALTHGVRSKPLLDDTKQIAHTWLALAVVSVIARVHLLPVDPYPFVCGSFIAIKALVVFKNTSDSGLNTPALDRLLALLRTRADATEGPKKWESPF